MKKFVCFCLVLFVLSGSMMFAVSAATLSIEDSTIANALKFPGVSSSALKVSDMCEDARYYYFLIGVVDELRNIAVARVMKSDGSVKVFSVYSQPELQGFVIESFSVDNYENIWLKLVGDSVRCAIIRSDSIDYIDTNCVLGRGCCVWIDNDYANVWDGKDTKKYKFDLSGSNVLAFSAHQGNPAFILGNGDIYMMGNEGWEIVKLSELMGIPIVLINYAQLVSIGDTLWLSASVVYNVDNADGSYGAIESSGLFPVSILGAKAVFDIADTILYASRNADGSLYFIVRMVYPIVPNPAPGETDDYYVVTVPDISNNSLTKIETVIGPPVRKYVGQNGDTWSYGIEPGIVITKSDDTSIAYLPPGVLTRSDIAVVFNGTEIGFDSDPFIEEGRTMVPVRGIAYLLGAETAWDPATKTVTFTRDGTTIKLVIGQKSAFMNTVELPLDAPAMIQNGRTMVPLRFVAEAFDAKVSWEKSTRTVIIDG